MTVAAPDARLGTPRAAVLYLPEPQSSRLPAPVDTGRCRRRSGGRPGAGRRGGGAKARLFTQAWKDGTEMRTQNAHSLGALLGGVAIALMSGCGPATPPPIGPEPETVSIGYGTQPRGDVTGSVASLSAHDLDNAGTARVEEMLQGRLAGVQVIRTANGDFSVRVRGAGSFFGNGEPLVVVDGLPIAGGGLKSVLAAIAPQDIARIDVLKDAGTAAIYGSRAANGVIIITTKRQR